MGTSPGLVAGNSGSSSSNPRHLPYFLIAVKSPQLCAVSLAQTGLWNDKALQDVSGKSALTPPVAFYGPEGEGVRSRLPVPLIELCVCEHIPLRGRESGSARVCVRTGAEAGSSSFPSGRT